MLAAIAGLTVLGMLGVASAWTIGWITRDESWVADIEQREQRKGAQRDEN